MPAQPAAAAPKTKKKASATDGTLPKIRGSDAAAVGAPSPNPPRESGAGQAVLKRVSAPFAAVQDSGADAAGAGAAAASLLRKATGSITSSGRPTSGQTKNSAVAAAAAAPRPPLSGSGRGSAAGRGGGKGSGKGSAKGGSGGASATSRGTRSASKARRSTASRGGGRGKGGKGGRGKGRGNSARQQQHQLQVIAASMEALQEQEQTQRHGTEVEEELELDTFRPVYNVLLMEMVRTQVEQVNRRQRALNEMLETFKEEGTLGGGGVGLRDEQQIDTLVERLRARLQSDGASELQTLRSRNSNLQHSLDEATLALEKKNSEMEVLRVNYARKLARTDVENDTMRAEVQATLHASTLDVERIKRELGHRIDIACASIRTPRYNTSMEAMRELVQQAQEEVQRHHDELTKLIVSIGAKDTFLKDEADTMHSNLPAQYRTQLRRMEKDQLLNLLDVLSFQDGVVDTVGKAIYVITESQHKTAVV
ncbi:hypothetical protein NESM_000102900 [Novymonas esmeraldas]|uniref:Uncharacterized protein n=1 Tax=Novymonas esmeraldas TaxID=1808958 RepID=A0AAW0F4B3_9TRYP